MRGGGGVTSLSATSNAGFADDNAQNRHHKTRGKKWTGGAKTPSARYLLSHIDQPGCRLQDYERIKRGDLPVTIDVRLCTPLTAGCETKRDRGVCGGYITVVVGVAFLMVVLSFG